MELRQLAVVVAVAEEGGFTAAAQRLRTVQSTVSTVVRALERDLGTPLFHRTTHRVALTPAGEAFMPAARAALEAAARARAAVSPVCGQVRLGVCPGLLADWHRVLAALRHVHPGLVVEVRQVRACEVGRVLAESAVDVVLTVMAECGASGSAMDSAGRNGSATAPDAAAHGGAAVATGLDALARGLAPGNPAAHSTTTGSAAHSLATGDPGTGPASHRPLPGDRGLHVAGDSAAGPPAHRPLPSDRGLHAAGDPATGPASHRPLPGDRGLHATGDSAAGPASLVTVSLPGEELVLATAPGGSRSAPADLSELSLVDFPVGWAVREAVDRAFPRRRVSLEVDDLGVAAGLVRAGLAGCVLPASAAARFPDLTVRRFDRPPPWQLGAVHRGDPSPAVAALLAQFG